MAQADNLKDSKRVVVDLTMTVEEARQVIWQDLYHPQEPIGNLLDTKRIQYGNLCWAVNGARTQEMRAASRTLLATWLGQPATLEATRRYGPEVVEGSHYLEDKQEDSLMNYAMYGLGGGIMIVFLAMSFVQNILSYQSHSIPLPVVILVDLILLGLLGVWVFRRARRELINYRDARRGRWGEEAVVERLRVALDNHWVIFHNLHLPDRKDDLDIVLVGPGGVWALEVKAFKENVRALNDTWERQTKGGWKKLDHNPSKQVAENATRLNVYLQKQGIKRWIEKAVVMAQPQPISNFEHSTVDVWLLPTLESKTTVLATRNPPSEAETKNIARLLSDLAKKQIAVEEAKYKKKND